MKEKALNHLVEILSALVILSSIFYCAGLVEKYAYFYVLNVPIAFISADYWQDLLHGYLQYIGLLPYILLSAEQVFVLWSLDKVINSAREHLSKIRERILTVTDQKTKQTLGELQTQTQND